MEITSPTPRAAGANPTVSPCGGSFFRKGMPVSSFPLSGGAIAYVNATGSIAINYSSGPGTDKFALPLDTFTIAGQSSGNITINLPQSVGVAESGTLQIVQITPQNVKTFTCIDIVAAKAGSDIVLYGNSAPSSLSTPSPPGIILPVAILSAPLFY